MLQQEVGGREGLSLRGEQVEGERALVLQAAWRRPITGRMPSSLACPSLGRLMLVPRAWAALGQSLHALPSVATVGV